MPFGPSLARSAVCMWPDVSLAAGLGNTLPTAGSVVRRKTHYAPSVAASTSRPASPAGAASAPPPLRAANWFNLHVAAPEGAPADQRVCCMVGAHQVDERTAGGPKYLDLGLALLEDVSGELLPLTCPNEKGEHRPCSVGAAAHRDALLVAYLLPGIYAVVPTSSGRAPEEASSTGATPAEHTRPQPQQPSH